MRQKTTIREAIPCLIKPNGMLTDTDEEKAEVLSNFFASVFTDEPPGNWEISVPPTASIDDTLELTMNDIREELNRLDTSKSPGPDGIHPRALFELRELILKQFFFAPMILLSLASPRTFSYPDLPLNFKSLVLSIEKFAHFGPKKPVLKDLKLQKVRN